MDIRAPMQPRGRRPDQRRSPSLACLGALILCCVGSMGCLSFSCGGRTINNPHDDPSVLSQTGSVTVVHGQELQVYYPVPYASPPNLELDDNLHRYEIIDQKPDRFRIRNVSGLGNFEVRWTARGVRATPAIVPPVTVPVSVNGSNP